MGMEVFKEVRKGQLFRLETKFLSGDNWHPEIVYCILKDVLLDEHNGRIREVIVDQIVGIEEYLMRTENYNLVERKFSGLKNFGLMPFD